MTSIYQIIRRHLPGAQLAKGSEYLEVGFEELRQDVGYIVEEDKTELNDAHTILIWRRDGLEQRPPGAISFIRNIRSAHTFKSHAKQFRKHVKVSSEKGKKLCLARQEGGFHLRQPPTMEAAPVVSEPANRSRAFATETNAPVPNQTEPNYRTSPESQSPAVVVPTATSPSPQGPSTVINNINNNTSYNFNINHSRTRYGNAPQNDHPSSSPTSSASTEATSRAIPSPLVVSSTATRNQILRTAHRLAGAASLSSLRTVASTASTIYEDAASQF